MSKMNKVLKNRLTYAIDLLFRRRYRTATNILLSIVEYQGSYDEWMEESLKRCNLSQTTGGNWKYLKALASLSSQLTESLRTCYANRSYLIDQKNALDWAIGEIMEILKKRRIQVDGSKEIIETRIIPLTCNREAVIATGIRLAANETNVKLVQGILRGQTHWWLRQQGRVIDPSAHKLDPPPTKEEYIPESTIPMDFELIGWLLSNPRDPEPEAMITQEIPQGDISHLCYPLEIGSGNRTGVPIDDTNGRTVIWVMDPDGRHDEVAQRITQMLNSEVGVSKAEQPVEA